MLLFSGADAGSPVFPHGSGGCECFASHEGSVLSLHSDCHGSAKALDGFASDVSALEEVLVACGEKLSGVVVSFQHSIGSFVAEKSTQVPLEDIWLVGGEGFVNQHGSSL